MEIKVTVFDQAVMWGPIERARADHEYALRRDKKLADGEFVAIKSHRIQQVDVKGKQAYDVYVTLEVQMGPGHPNPEPDVKPTVLEAPDMTKTPPGSVSL